MISLFFYESFYLSQAQFSDYISRHGILCNLYSFWYLDEDDETIFEVSHPHRIPLVPRRPTSSEGFFPIPTPAGDKRDAKGTKSRAGKGKKEEKAAPSTSAEEAQESPQPPADPDERVR